MGAIDEAYNRLFEKGQSKQQVQIIALNPNDYPCIFPNDSTNRAISVNMATGSVDAQYQAAGIVRVIATTASARFNFGA